MVPKSAIGKPKAALVATAFCILTLHQIIQGTEIKPPPAPTKAERIPIAMPMKNLPIVPGKLRSGRGDLFKNILNAENPTKAAKIKDSQNVGNQPAICAPTTAPTKMPGATEATTFHKTAPRLWCALTEEREVKAMVASDVAMAT